MTITGPPGKKRKREDQDKTSEASSSSAANDLMGLDLQQTTQTGASSPTPCTKKTRKKVINKPLKNVHVHEAVAKNLIQEQLKNLYEEAEKTLLSIGDELAKLITTEAKPVEGHETPKFKQIGQEKACSSFAADDSMGLDPQKTTQTGASSSFADPQYHPQNTLTTDALQNRVVPQSIDACINAIYKKNDTTQLKETIQSQIEALRKHIDKTTKFINNRKYVGNPQRQKYINQIKQGKIKRPFTDKNNLQKGWPDIGYIDMEVIVNIFIQRAQEKITEDAFKEVCKDALQGQQNKIKIARHQKQVQLQDKLHAKVHKTFCSTQGNDKIEKKSLAELTKFMNQEYPQVIYGNGQKPSNAVVRSEFRHRGLTENNYDDKLQTNWDYVKKKQEKTIESLKIRITQALEKVKENMATICKRLDNLTEDANQTKIDSIAQKIYDQFIRLSSSRRIPVSQPSLLSPKQLFYLETVLTSCVDNKIDTLTAEEVCISTQNKDYSHARIPYYGLQIAHKGMVSKYTEFGCISDHDGVLASVGILGTGPRPNEKIRIYFHALDAQLSGQRAAAGFRRTDLASAKDRIKAVEQNAQNLNADIVVVGEIGKSTLQHYTECEGGIRTKNAKRSMVAFKRTGKNNFFEKITVDARENEDLGEHLEITIHRNTPRELQKEQITHASLIHIICIHTPNKNNTIHKLYEYIDSKVKESTTNDTVTYPTIIMGDTNLGNKAPFGIYSAIDRQIVREHLNPYHVLAPYMKSKGSNSNSASRHDRIISIIPPVPNSKALSDQTYMRGNPGNAEDDLMQVD